jgi:hypothetical protein
MAEYQVKLVSGEKVSVQTAEEQRWLVKTRTAYSKELRLTASTDLRDLDRLLILELNAFRLTQQLAVGKDYEGRRVDPEKWRTQLHDASRAITLLKNSMGLSKAARDAAASEGNFSAWFTELKQRAGEFNVHRNEQLRKALVLFNELKNIVQTFDRCDETERRQSGFETETDLLDWIRKTAIPEYDELDRFFREHSQSLWIRALAEPPSPRGSARAPKRLSRPALSEAS